MLTDFVSATERIVENSYHNTASAAEKERYLHALRENDPQTLYGDFLAVANFDVRDQVASLQIPTLLLCGRHDRMTPPALSELLHARIAGSRLHLIEDAGHNVPLEQPLTVAAHLGGFLDELTAPDAR
jgi:pimeloyl-ACP methyl ester carboxylesterase